jgi:16S rRNA (uracil1498-N3)-methyltransferase
MTNQNLKRKKRFFIAEEDINKDIFFIKYKEYNHLKNVLRLVEGNIVFAVTPNGFEYKGEILEINDEFAKCKILEKIIQKIEKKIVLTMMTSIIKEKKMALIFEKAVELGVDKIIPLISERSSFFEKTDKNKKIQRWDTIVKNSAKQCGNLKVTQVDCIKKIKDIDKFDFSCYTDVLLLSFQRQYFIQEIFEKFSSDKDKKQKVLVIIGPEGGFTEQEEQLFIDSGAVPVCCSSNVFRAETAFFYIASLFNFYNESQNIY